MAGAEQRAQRREAIARATWAVLMRDGVRGASVRAVLAEAKMTSGAMRYYFRSHDELLTFAAEHILEQSAARVRERLADEGLSGRERVRAVVGEILPLDAARATEITVFARLAEVDDTSGRGKRARESAYRGCRALAEFAVAELSAPGRRADPSRLSDRHRRLAEWFHLGIDGLAYQFVLYPGLLSHEDVAAALDTLADLLEQNIRCSGGPGEADEQ